MIKLCWACSDNRLELRRAGCCISEAEAFFFLALLEWDPFFLLSIDKEEELKLEHLDEVDAGTAPGYLTW